MLARGLVSVNLLGINGRYGVILWALLFPRGQEIPRVIKFCMRGGLPHYL
jgi:hypothetical protein